MRRKKTGRKTASFTSGSEVWHIIRIATPSAIGLVSIFSFNIADAFFVAQLGIDELTAISFTFPIVFLFIGIIIGLGIGASSVLSRLIGSKKWDRLAPNATHSLIFVVLVVLVITLLGVLTIDPLFRFMGAEGRVLALIHDYMPLWYLSGAFLVIPIVGNQLIRAHNHLVFPAIVMVSSSLLNVAFDWILIFGFLGFPALGIKGAAVASLIARIIAFVMSFSYLHFRARLVDWRLPKKHAMIKDWKELVRISVPATTENAIPPFSEWVLVLLLAKFGSEAVATYGVISRIYAVIYIPYLALAISMVPFSGQNWGSGAFKRIQNGLRAAIIIAAIWCLCSSSLLLWIAKPIIHSFSDVPQVRLWSILYLKLIPITYIGGAVGLVVGSVFYGAGQPLKALTIQAMHWVVLYLPLAFIVSFFGGVEGILLIEGVANILAGIIAFLIFYYMRRHWLR